MSTRTLATVSAFWLDVTTARLNFVKASVRTRTFSFPFFAGSILVKIQAEKFLMGDWLRSDPRLVLDYYSLRVPLGNGDIHQSILWYLRSSKASRPSPVIDPVSFPRLDAPCYHEGLPRPYFGVSEEGQAGDTLCPPVCRVDGGLPSLGSTYRIDRTVS